MGEGLIYGVLVLNLSLSTVIILLNVALLYLLRHEKTASREFDAISFCFKQAVKAAQFGKIHAVETAVIASSLQIPVEDVFREYEKDSMERRAIVYSVVGEDYVSKKFLNEFHSQFTLIGYEGEDQLLRKEI